jgi:hypothetical protein
MPSPFQICISNISEIRMGSPYSFCEIELIGYNKLNLPKRNAWQDKYAWNSDYSKLVLIKFDLENNDAGFRLFIINVKTGEATESKRYFGLINNISIFDEKVIINKFLYDKQKSEPGNLCCEINEEHDIL